MSALDADLVIVGAGAAGLMAAIAARGATPASPPSVLLLDGARKIGLKILVSGGGRCNVTNEQVGKADFDSDAPPLVAGVLRALPPAQVRAFFEQRGCALYAEPLGKLFPRSDRARDVLAVLTAAVAAAGAQRIDGTEVEDVTPGTRDVTVRTAARTLRARRVIIATGGRSMPGTGSRGFGLELAARLGHDLDPPLPALVPLVLAPDSPLAGLAGVTVPATLTLATTGTAPEQIESARFRPLVRAAGSLLITHRGASGPAALDVSGACALALHHAQRVTLEADFLGLMLDDSAFAPYRALAKPPGASLPPEHTRAPTSFATFMAVSAALRADSARRSVLALVATWLPRSLGAALLRTAGVDATLEVGALAERDWRGVHRALAHADLKLQGTLGYEKAEVTRGGVRLRELHRASLESRVAPRVHFCGEVCSATGRLGGFNFQWAWSSGHVAGSGAALALTRERDHQADACAS